MKSMTADVVATRTVTKIQAAEVSKLQVELRKPRQLSADEWICEFLVTTEGLPPLAQSAYGLDSFQALLMALEGIRVYLLDSGGEYMWEGADDNAGFPRLVPLMFGGRFAEHLSEMMDREVERVSLDAQARHVGKIERGDEEESS